MILVMGFGTITSGIIQNLLVKSREQIALYSKHIFELKNVEVINILSEIKFNDYSVIITCFESDEKYNEFFTYLNNRYPDGGAEFIIIDLSTVKVSSVINVQKKLPKSIKYVESPVTGSKMGSINGTLSAFVYHELTDTQWSYIKKIMSMFVSKIYIFSSFGIPMKFKLFYNTWGAYILYSMKLFNLKKLGLTDSDYDISKKIITTDGWMSKVCASKLFQVENQNFNDVHFKLEYMIKDLEYAQEEVFGIQDENIQKLLDEYMKVNHKYKKMDFSIIVGDNDYYE